MNGKRNLTVLVAGFILIVAGALFLAINIGGLSLPWRVIFKLVVPGLFLLVGLLKLIRHFTWNEEELMQRPGRASLLAGLFWASLGAVLLLDVLNVLNVFRFVGTYWPLLLIIYGLGKVVDYYRLTQAARIRVGEIFGVVFIAVFGWSFGKIADAHIHLIRDVPIFADLNLEEWPLTISLDPETETFTFEASESIDLSRVEQVEIRNLYGDVRLLPSDDGNPSVELKKEVRGETESAAAKIADDVLILLESAESRLVIESNRKELGDRGKKLNTHLIVRLPDHLPAKVSNSYGNIHLKQRRGDCDLENSYGKIEVREVQANLNVAGRYQKIDIRNVEGAVNVSNRRAAVTVLDVSGDVEISNDYDTARIENIRGNVVVRNQFGRVQVENVSGTANIEAKGSRVQVVEVADTVTVNNSRERVEARDLDQALNLTTSYSSVSLSRIAGPVEVQAAHSEIAANNLEDGIRVQGRSTEVTLENISGELGIETSLRSVSVSDFNGALSIQNEYGEVMVEAAESPTQPVKIINKNGDVDISIPGTANCRLSAQSVSGEIVSDFGPEPQQSEGSVSLLETEVGKGGPEIELQTTHARIQIKRRG